MIRYFGTYSKHEVFTILFIPSVADVRKTLSDISGMCKPIWL